jgi:hypothetical protein
MLAGRLWSRATVVVMAAALVACGSSSKTPTAGPSTTPGVATPTPVPTPAGIILPSGMMCSPTPPPLLRMHIKVQAEDGSRTILDSSPLVPNVDNYCDRVGFGAWKFCETRPEGDPQRVACDYLAVGIASDTGRWGPRWIGEGKPCGAEFSQCANHATNQFLAIARGKGEFQACVAEDAPVSDRGVRCTMFEFY